MASAGSHGNPPGGGAGAGRRFFRQPGGTIGGVRLKSYPSGLIIGAMNRSTFWMIAFTSSSERPPLPMVIEVFLRLASRMTGIRFVTAAGGVHSRAWTPAVMTTLFRLGEPASRRPIRTKLLVRPPLVTLG